ncbi:creatine kinase S- mitochondrial [Brachionus plicatilis]|uniref:Creatine kinase S-mitochondrial n=1 Tax=Brachionus plicatilis TaxID=10195 RepID=A0A3M7SA50_BRAPC|nr:creatine kinase S- mitochondrial [Brachionus plicatilis]
MYKNFLTKLPIRVIAASVGGLLVYQKVGEISEQPLSAAGLNYSRRFYPASSEYPDLTRNRNIMARNLTQDLYARLRDRRTPNGFTVDNAIQPGVDNSGTYAFTGIVAGDEESYVVFRELFDKVILEKHGYKPDQVHPTDLDASKIQNAQLDPEYVLSIRLRVIRNIKGYCLPSFCTRGERRDIENIIVKALYSLKDLNGTYYALKELSQDEETSLANKEIYMNRPYHPNDLSANLGKDWPDARGIWLNHDRTLAAFVNRRDHVVLSLMDRSSDLGASFTKFVDFVKKFEDQVVAQKWKLMHNKHLGYVTTDPKNLGTTLKLTVRVNLPNLCHDSRLSAILKILNLSQSFKLIGDNFDIDEPVDKGDTTHSVAEISSKITLGKSEVEITQAFIQSINKLIEVEKIVANGGQLDEFLYPK